MIDDGYYKFEDPPSTGLGAARMSALLTYRSRDSFEARFGRNVPDPSKRQNIRSTLLPNSSHNEHWSIHNDGHKNAGSPRPSRTSSSVSVPTAAFSDTNQQPPNLDPEFHRSPPPLVTSSSSASPMEKHTPTYFSAQSYLRYQGDKFIKRFDANCYIAITRKLDTHDVSRGRLPPTASYPDPHTALHHALSQIRQPTLILGIMSDGLFTFAEQQELAAAIPDSRLRTIDSPEGHDAFLLEFEQVNAHLLDFMRDVLPDIMGREPVLVEGARADGESGNEGADGGFQAAKSSVFGEAEVDDITAW